MPDRPSLPARLDRAALMRWLGSDAVVDDQGRVWSWHNPRHPGYAYPEAGGLWLALMAREPEVSLDRLDRVAGWLADCERRRQVGRVGHAYLFDRGMVLAGQLAWSERSRGSVPSGPATVSALLADIAARRPIWPPVSDERWSTRFGPHLLKLALPLTTWAERADRREELDAALRSLFVTLAPVLDDGRVVDPTGEAATYLHAHCYAAEGLWRLSTVLPAPLGARAGALATEAADWLARVQRSDGGLPPWHDGQRGWGPAPADVAAQAVRLWSGLDPVRHRDAIERALAFVARLHHPGGGVRYHEHSDDQNTWATVFTVQALDFARGVVDVRRLI